MDIPGRKQGNLFQPPPTVRPGPEFESHFIPTGSEDGLVEITPQVQEIPEHPQLSPDVRAVLQQHPSALPAPQSEIDAFAGKESPISVRELQAALADTKQRTMTESLRWRVLSWVRQLAQRLRLGNK